MRYERIISDPAILNGQPIIRGTRLSVRRVLAILAEYPDASERRLHYPQLTDEDIRQALAYASDQLDDRIQFIEVVN